ncbi:Rv1733c family protein [Actinoplanes sp. CA-015351]|uniref:Rv1733c family protein n=1 Tax=Actinoplanes sp. CA-015351 TaxID=3239897 RepID=UPI003D95B3AF
MGNPLRRRSDRIESLMVFTLVMVFLAGAPALGWWSGRSSYFSDVRAEEWERTHIFSVPAEIISEPAPLGASGPATAAPRAAQARWTGPDGGPHSGLVPVGAAARLGDTISVWVDDRGQLRGPPVDRDPVAQAVMAGVATILCLLAALAGLRRIGLVLLDRHRSRVWQREWLEVGPRWSRDRR